MAERTLGAVSRRPAAFPRVVATSAEKGVGMAQLRAEINAGGPLMTETAEEPGWATAKTLAEALPYIQIYDRQTVVIKYGGHAMGEEALARLFAADAVLLKLLGVWWSSTVRVALRSRPCWKRPGSSPPSWTAFGSPTRPPWRWPRWSSSGAHQQGNRQLDHPRRGPRPTCAEWAFRARTLALSRPSEPDALARIRIPASSSGSTWGLSASRAGSIPSSSRT